MRDLASRFDRPRPFLTRCTEVGALELEAEDGDLSIPLEPDPVVPLELARVILLEPDPVVPLELARAIL